MYTFTIGAITYAIVAAVYDNGVQIIDVSDPDNLNSLDRLEDLDEFDALSGAVDVEIFTIGASTYAIVASMNADGVQIIDVSDPANIIPADILTDAGFLVLQEPKGVDTFTVGASTYAIVASFADNGVQMIDVSDPSNIVAKYHLTDTASLELDGAIGF